MYTYFTLYWALIPQGAGHSPYKLHTPTQTDTYTLTHTHKHTITITHNHTHTH